MSVSFVSFASTSTLFSLLALSLYSFPTTVSRSVGIGEDGCAGGVLGVGGVGFGVGGCWCGVGLPGWRGWFRWGWGEGKGRDELSEM